MHAVIRRITQFKSSLRKFCGRHHDLVYNYGISESQMTTDMFQLIVVTTFLSFPHSLLISGFVTDAILLELFTLPGNCVHFRFLMGFVLLDLQFFCVVSCRSLFVLSSILFWLFCWLSFFGLRILITPLVYLSSSRYTIQCAQHVSGMTFIKSCHNKNIGYELL